ncbi:MAG: hypothetical protein Q8L48_24420 [Archangium sp.]|nr:hypothetical protein [Archangium sp.]
MTEGEGPRCALHFDAPSLAPCQRCGRFCCQTCLVEREPPLCSACAPSVVDPYGIHARAFELVPAFVAAFKLVLAELPNLLALVVIFALPSAALQVALVGTGDDLKTVSTSIRIGTFYEFFVGLVGAQAMLALFIARSQGRRLSLGAALNEGVQNWRRAAGARFRAGLTIFAFALLLVLPAFWKMTMLMFSSIAVLRSHDRDALDASEQLVRGRFGLCFGFALAAIGVCYVPMFIGLTIIGVLSEALTLPRFPMEFVTDVVDRFSQDVAMASLLYVAYVMLHRTAGIELAPMRWHRVPPLSGE